MTNIPAPTPDCLEKTVSIELSRSGKNAFYHHCDEYNGRSNYAVCLHTIEAVRERRVQLRSECPNAINCGSCPAIHMRKEELAAGKALFFADRDEQIERNRAALEQMKDRYGYSKSVRNKSITDSLSTRLSSKKDLDKYASGMRSEAEIKSAPTKSTPAIPSGNMMADAINELMKESKE